jgi:tetratricopeptide (TPR) repeat protein
LGSQAYPLPSQGITAAGDDYIARFEAGRRASQAGQFDRAVEEYKVVLRMSPGLTEARFNLGLAYHALGQYGLAVHELEEVRRQRPSLVGANLFLGIDYLKLRRPAEAKAPLEAALQTDPSNREARRALASCYLQQDLYGKAQEQFHVLAASDADRADGLYELGQSYLELVKQLSIRLAQHHQESAWAYRLAGDLLAERDQWTDAAVLYQKAIALDPEQAGLDTSLGKMYLHQGKLQAAEKEFRKDLQLDSKNEETLIALGELYLAKGEVRIALENVTLVWDEFAPYLARQADFPSIKVSLEVTSKMAAELEAVPDTPAKHFLLSVLYQRLGDDKGRDLWTVFEKELAGWKEKPVSSSDTSGRLCESHLYVACVSVLQSEEKRSSTENMLLGKGLLALGQPSRAADTFASVLESDRANLAAIYWLARTYGRLANDSFQQLVGQFPDSWQAHQFQGQAHQLRYAYDDAIQEFELAIHSHPGAPELHEALGRLYYLKKSYSQATEALRQAIQLDPTRAPSLYLLGRTYLDWHQAEESIACLQAALRYDPGLLEARAALGQAYMRSGRAAEAVPELEKAESTDTYGDLHYLLYVAYRKLGKEPLAQKALARSQELRKSSAAHHQEKVAEAEEEQGQP